MRPRSGSWAFWFIQGSSGSTTNGEIKSVDNTANSYLAAAVLVAATQDGLTRELTLPPPVTADPHTLAEDERRRCAIERLPTSLKESIAAMGESDFIRATLGDPLFDSYLAARRGDLATAAGMPEQDLVLRLRGRYC
jgi:glutamine synthetase